MKRIARWVAAAALLTLAVGGLSAQTPLTVQMYDRAQPGYVATNSWQTKWIQAQVKKELGIDVTFVAVPRFQETDKINLLMAAGQAPDISYLYDEATITRYLKDGGLTDLTKLMPKFAPNLVKYMGPEHLEFGQWGGKQWAIPAKRVFTGAFAGAIRKDWLDKLGLKVPTTTDELYKVLKAFKEKDPGNVGKDKLIPFALTLDPGNPQWTSALIWEAFRKPVSTEVGATTERWNVPGTKDAIQYLNKLYNEGLVSPNFVLDKDGSQYNKDIAQGNVGAMIHNFDMMTRANPGLETELEKNVPGAKMVPFDLQNNNTKLFSKWSYNSNGLFIFVPRFSKNAEAALKYLNWMSKPEVLFFLQNGTKGVQYTDVVNGIPTKFIPQDKLDDADKWHAGDVAFLVNGKEFGSTEKNLDALSLGYTGFESLVKQSMAISLRDAYRSTRIDRVIESESKLRQSLNTKGAEIFVKSITAPPADFSKTYDALTAEYMAAGGTQIETERKAAYKAMLAEQAAEN